MFLNLSNHPSKSWSTEQISSANEKFGEIIDIECPVTEASISEEQIKELANNIVMQIEELKPKAVMCVGEFSFSYAVISKLRSLGIKVVSVKSDLKVKTFSENGIEKREMLYKFLNFEEYNDYSTLDIEAPSGHNDILLNCSYRFCSDTFDEKCLTASKKFGKKIIDLPLEPVVDKDHVERESIIKNYVSQINEITPKSIILDGEFHTWYAMASLLKRLGYTVICKCSNRDVVEIQNDDGTSTKITDYKFVRYRKLEEI